MQRPERWSRRLWGGSLAAILALATVVAVYGQQDLGQPDARRAPTTSSAIPAAEFSRIIQQFSEEGGYFQSDNFTSNETAYLHIVSRLQEIGVSGEPTSGSVRNRTSHTLPRSTRASRFLWTSAARRSSST